MDAAIPADAQNAPTGIWKSRTEREIPTAPTPIIVVVNERKNNGDSNSVAKPSTESDQAQGGMRHSSIERTNRSAYALRLGLFGGRRIGWTPPPSRISPNPRSGAGCNRSSLRSTVSQSGKLTGCINLAILLGYSTRLLMGDDGSYHSSFSSGRIVPRALRYSTSGGASVIWPFVKPISIVVSTS